MVNNNKNNARFNYLSMLEIIDGKAKNASNIPLLNSNFKSIPYIERLIHAYKYDRDEVHLPPELCSDDVSEDLETLLKTVVLMELVGLSDTARKLKKYIHKINLIKDLEVGIFDCIVNEEARKIISETNRKNASGVRNIKNNECVEIMRATWERHPNASKNRMVELLFNHFNGAVSRETLKRWIKSNELGPKEEVRPAPFFQLVIPS